MANQPENAEHPPAGVPQQEAGLRRRLYDIIFEADTRSGKLFDVVLLVTIVVSVVVVMLESVEAIRVQWGGLLRGIEWTITVLFTIEYLLRLICVRNRWRYATSFFGIVDLLAILPTYLRPFIGGSQSLSVIKVLRLVRVFRVFKLGRYVQESQVLMRALRATQPKITVFLLVIMTLVLVMGTLLYVVESPQPDSDFTSIPRSVYWAIVTITTVGYGDIAPQTILGQTLAAVAMILGYSIIIVPSGIFSVEIITAHKQSLTTQTCPDCLREGHDEDARHCKYCGQPL